MTDHEWNLDSLAVHAGREDLAGLGVHVPPIDLSSTYPLPDIESGGMSYDAMASGGGPTAGGPVYARLLNPTVARFEEVQARMERNDTAVAFASGMAALTATLLAASSQRNGRHVVAVRPLYGGTDHILDAGLLGTEVTYCDAHEISSALRDDTCLIVLETPANPTLQLVDLEAVTKAAAGRPVLVDNTFATPVLQNPAEFGVDLVLHSATKYLGGHGDVVAGVVATSAEWAAKIRPIRAITGGILHPLAGYLLHRGLATLPLRVRAQQENARQLADWLTTVSGVQTVYYPGLASCDPEGLVGRQMRGPGAMIALDLTGGYAHAAQMIKRLRLFTHAVSLGGVDSLIQHPAGLTHRIVAEDARPNPGIVRLSIGLEDVADLRADLDQAIGE
jgi:methionine-gamma-lyase